MRTIIGLLILNAILDVGVFGSVESEYPKIKSVGEKYKICAGVPTPEASLQWNPKTVYHFMRSKYGNCTHVTGHLSISGTQPSHNLSFLSSIVEVIGSVYIVSNNLTTLPLTNLKVIRGQGTLKSGGKDYALYISHNSVPPGRPGYVGLRSLKSIVQHDVFIGSNPGLCNLGTVNWQSVFEDPKKQKVVRKNPKGVSCAVNEACSSKCRPLAGRRYCWGPEDGMCQRIDPCNRAKCQDIGGRCVSADGGQRCCHEECVGGCTGISRRDCFACRNFLNGKECRRSCPPPTIYSHKLFQLIPNPKFKVSLGVLCVDKCPKHFLREDRSCVKTCSKQSIPHDGFCKPCHGKCKSVCRMREMVKELLKKNPSLMKTNLIGKTGEPSHTLRSLMVQLRNCTILDGNLLVSLTARPEHESNEHIRPQDFENLKNLKRINGDIHLNLREHPEIKNLSFLSSLEVITSSGRKGIEIVMSKVQFYGLVSLKKVTAKRWVSMFNKDLCYMEKFKERFPKLTTYMPRHSKTFDACQSEGKTCDPACDPATGCWGPGRNMCFACRQRRAGRECVAKCEDAVGYFTNATSKDCAKCHPECRRSCTGSKANQCVGGCKNAKDGPYCVSKCPFVKYLDKSSGECKECSKSCMLKTESEGVVALSEPACTGPVGLPRPGGCRRCYYVEVHRNRSLARCLSEGKKVEQGYTLLRESLVNEVKRRDPHVSKHIAVSCQFFIKCHPWCATCFGEKNSMCERCHPDFFKFDDTRCVQTCKERFAYESTSLTGEKVCLPCDKNCREGCRSGSRLDCIACRNMKIYLNETKESWMCNDTCPAHLKYTFTEEDTRDTVCVATPVSQGRRKLAVGLSATAGIILLIVIGAIVIVCVQKRRARLLADRDILRARYTRKLDQEMVPLNTTDYQPNLGQLRMINAKRLTKLMEIGSGAFGTVFKGVWKPEKESKNELEISIDVAIKELKESGNLTSTKDFLSEAHVMASVDHPFCIGLLGVCLTTRMQLISEFMPLGSLSSYLPKHKFSLGSQRLLTWAMQIAKGMGYLESRGIVHRDLAARNVLLQNEEQVRITDFGLAKLVDPGGDSIHAEGGRFPVKWLAIESLADRTFSHKSDVWSYGVTLWEIFMFGERPYQELRAAEMYDFLDSGERLKQPPICTLDMYMLLIKCWLLEPEGRPTFGELVEDVSQMASDPGRYLIIEHDRLRRAPVRDSMQETGSTSPRASGIYPEKQKPPAVVNLPPAGLPHLESQLARRQKPPSMSDHYTDDPVAANDPAMHLPPPPPPPPAAPLAGLDEEDEVEVGDFPVDQDYLIPDAGDMDDYVPPTPQPAGPAKAPRFPNSAPPPAPSSPPPAEYVNEPARRPNTAQNPAYHSQFGPPEDGEDYLSPDADEYVVPSPAPDVDSADYLQPLITKRGPQAESPPRA